MNRSVSGDGTGGGLFDPQTRAAVDLSAEAEVEVEEAVLPPASVLGARKALRRLQSAPPTVFEQVIDLMYEWKEHDSDVQATDIMRRVLSQNHNLNDTSAVQAMRNSLKDVRMDRVTNAIHRLGLDEAERILGLKGYE